MSSAHYTIGQLAAQTGVPATTVRYYERIRLLQPAGRTENNYRYYDDEVLAKLRFIRAAQSTGLTLEDITELLGFRDGSTAPCAEIENLIERRLEDVRVRLDELRQVQRVLRSLKTVCEQSQDKEHCDVLESLNAISISEGGD